MFGRLAGPEPNVPALSGTAGRALNWRRVESHRIALHRSVFVLFFFSSPLLYYGLAFIVLLMLQLTYL